jgi:regulator of sigma E protease
MKVVEGGETAQGLEGGDVFRRVGSIEYPGSPDGIREIRSNKGRTIEIVVEREAADGSGVTLVELSPKVKSNGTIGFNADDTTRDSAIVSLPVEQLGKDEGAYTPAAVRLIDIPGTTIVAVDGRSVKSLGAVREALREATRVALDSGAGSAIVEMELRFPIAGEESSVTREWELTREEIERLHALGWRSPVPRSLFALQKFELRAESPAGALWMGIEETHRVMMSTYTTFLRLFQGSVKVEHLKGPVGIAHIGTQVADRGIIWLLFLGAVVSINLAVINFLPLPIVDGGQFVFLVLEQIRGKPVPVAIQNAAALAGIVLIGAVFLIVTFNDIVGLFG